MTITIKTSREKEILLLHLPLSMLHARGLRITACNEEIQHGYNLLMHGLFLCCGELYMNLHDLPGHAEVFADI